jgi:broad specificity phosphatase PhoE
MATVYFITHPEVVIDPAVPVTQWPLSPRGIERITRMLEQPWTSRIATIFSSAERKAFQAAHMLAHRLSLKPTIIEDLGENDRSSTGYLPKAEFETVADQFFVNPNESVRGWERAVDAQTRIVDAVRRVIVAAGTDEDTAIISHGAVGALLLCHLKHTPISRRYDQPVGGGGNLFSFEAATWRLLSAWRRIEDQAL